MFRRTLELDDVAVGVGDVKRGAVAFGAVAPPDFANSDAVSLQMRRQRGEVEGADAHREMVQVASCRPRRLRPGAGRHQIDHRRAGAQLHELGLVEPALDVTAQHIPVEFDRAIKIGDPQNEVVERRDLNRASFRSFSTLQRSYVGHCQLLSIAVDHLTAIRPGLAGRLLRVIAAETGPIVTRRHENAGCAMRAFRPGRGRRCDPCPFGRIAPLRGGPHAVRPVR